MHCGLFLESVTPFSTRVAAMRATAHVSRSKRVPALRERESQSVDPDNHVVLPAPPLPPPTLPLGRTAATIGAVLTKEEK
jgi:hypothetical protein